MLFNNERCGDLTPENVNGATPAWLHRLEWAGEAVGDLPLAWNFLAGEYRESDTMPANIHYTLGVPTMTSRVETAYDQEWRAAYKKIKQTPDIDAWVAENPRNREKRA
jgi:hypothetical protein